MPLHKIAVVGAGVCGLSAALCLKRALPTTEVTIFADQLSPNTTSDVAGGFWKPHIDCDTPLELLRDWGRVTFDHLVRLAHSEVAREVGASMVSGDQLTSSDIVKEPFWKDIVYNYRPLSKDEVKRFPGMKSGFHYTTVIVDTSLYLQWLLKCLRDLGVRFEKKHVSSFSEFDGYDVIVNCTGLGAKTLVTDLQLVPVRGQIVRVKAPWIRNFLFCYREDGISYILPSMSTVTLGGTNTEGDWNMDLTETDKQDILTNCSLYQPSLKAAPFDKDLVSLRPFRNVVRLDMEMVKIRGKTVPVVHNYGHGGSGVTLHWGCAEHVVKIVTHALERAPFTQSKL